MDATTPAVKGERHAVQILHIRKIERGLDVIRQVRIGKVEVRDPIFAHRRRGSGDHDARQGTLRVDLAVTYRVTDPLATVTVTGDSDPALHREAQLVLRAALGTRTLDHLLADEERVGGEIEKELARRVASLGIRIRSVGLRDLVLPGDRKRIPSQVLVARKAAEANVIKRREETAAARSQANTARLPADDPVPARMKELEMLQEILAGAKTTFVLGPGELAAQVRTLVERDACDEG